MGRPKAALRLLGGAPALIRPERDFLRAEALRAQGYFAKASEVYRKLLARPPAADRALWLDCCLALASVHRSLGAVKPARRLWARGRSLMRTRGLSSYSERFELEDALIDRAAGLYPRSIGKLSRLLDRFRAERDWSAAGFVLWALGGARRFSGDLEGSRRDFSASLACARRGGDAAGMAYALFGLGGVLRIQGSFDRARASYAEASRRLARTDDVFGKAYAHCGLANVLRQKCLWSLAERHYNLAHKLYSSLGDAVDLAYVDWGLGQVHLRRGELKSAEKRFRLALAGFAAFDERRGEVLSEHSLAAVLHALGRTAQAEALFDRAVRRGRHAGLPAHLEIYT